MSPRNCGIICQVWGEMAEWEQEPEEGPGTAMIGCVEKKKREKIKSMSTHNGDKKTGWMAARRKQKGGNQHLLKCSSCWVCSQTGNLEGLTITGLRSPTLVHLLLFCLEKTTLHASPTYLRRVWRYSSSSGIYLNNLIVIGMFRVQPVMLGHETDNKSCDLVIWFSESSILLTSNRRRFQSKCQWIP